MKRLERTRQQLDPVGTIPTRVLALALASGAFIYGIVMTLLTLDQISSPLLAVLALVWLAGASLTVGLASSSLRAPFTSTTHMIVQLLALGAVALSAASQWGANRYIQDDFGSVSLGLLILSMGMYRPARELASIGVLSTIFVGFITLLKVPDLTTTAPPAAFVLVGMTPVIALSLAAAVYSGRLVEDLEKWQKRATLSLSNAAQSLTDGITESVRQDRVKILDREVFPFFTSILSNDTVTESDRARAKHIAESIRSLMVAEADRTWLEVVAGDDGVKPNDMHHSVVDARGRATSMLVAQRAVLRAFVSALQDDRSLIPGSIKVVITGTKVVNKGTLVASFHDAEYSSRVTYGPYFAVMRIVFPELQIEHEGNKLTVRFSYAQR